MPEASEAALDQWIVQTGPERILGETARAFATLSSPGAHCPMRYFPYFIGCVLSDHGGGTVPHTAPEVLLKIDPPFHARAQRLDYYLAWYAPYAEPATGHHWYRIAPPAGFEVHWPKSDWYPRHGADPDREQRKAWNRRFGEVKKALLAALPEDQHGTVSLMHAFLLGDRYQAQDGEWWDLPVHSGGKPKLKYRLASGPEVETPLEDAGEQWSRRLGRMKVLAAPLGGKMLLRPGQVEWVNGSHPSPVLPMPGGPIHPSWTPIPLPMFRDYRIAIQIAGGSAIGNLTDPVVVLDPNADKHDERLAHLCEVVVERAWVMRDLVWAIGGRPRNGPPVPGQKYDERARELYATYLAECRDTPNADRRSKIRRHALRQVQREFKGIPHAPLARGWYADIDAREGVRRRLSG